MFLKKYLNFILFGVNIIISVSLFGFLYYEYNYSNNELDSTLNTPLVIETNEENENDYIYVEVKGAVNSPGVYKLDNDNIINDVISLAGGFKKDAYTNNINLSTHVKDEMLIYVYTKSEYKKIEDNKQVESNNIIMQKEIINTCINNGESIIITGEDITVVNSNDLVNINTASKEELTSLNGIGDAKANAIIEYRNTNGLFSSIEDLLKVSGISQSLYVKIKAYITV